LTALLEARLRDRDKLQAERSKRFARLARSLMESDEELAIITMLLDDTYQQALHAPVTPPETASVKAAPMKAAPASRPAAASRKPRRRGGRSRRS
jgi:hypothetical protein